MTKEKTALHIPTAIQVCTDLKTHLGTSLGAQDMTPKMTFQLWKNALLRVPVSHGALAFCPLVLWEQARPDSADDYVPQMMSSTQWATVKISPWERINDSLSKSNRDQARCQPTAAQEIQQQQYNDGLHREQQRPHLD
jgi:hypothetical protein